MRNRLPSRATTAAKLRLTRRWRASSCAWSPRISRMEWMRSCGSLTRDSCTSIGSFGGPAVAPCTNDTPTSDDTVCSCEFWMVSRLVKNVCPKGVPNLNR